MNGNIDGRKVGFGSSICWPQENIRNKWKVVFKVKSCLSLIIEKYIPFELIKDSLLFFPFFFCQVFLFFSW